MEQTLFTTKHYASLAAIMLLAPIVPFALKNNDFELSEEDTHFITWYIHYGWYIIAATLLAGILTLINTFFYSNHILWITTQWLLIVAIIMIFFGIFTIVHNTPIFGKDWKIQTHITVDKNIVMYYIPFYNIYAWYTDITTKESYRWKKESILLWGVVVCILAIYPSLWVLIPGVTFILWRAIWLLFWFDLIPNNWKQTLNKLFVKYPEELLSYIIRYIVLRKKTTLIDEEHIYWEAKTVKTIRALIPMILVFILYTLLIRYRYTLDSSNLRIPLLPYIYFVWTYIVRFTTNNLSYQPVIDHIIRIFTSHKIAWKSL